MAGAAVATAELVVVEVGVIETADDMVAAEDTAVAAEVDDAALDDAALATVGTTEADDVALADDAATAEIETDDAIELDTALLDGVNVAITLEADTEAEAVARLADDVDAGLNNAVGESTDTKADIKVMVVVLLWTAAEVEDAKDEAVDVIEELEGVGKDVVAQTTMLLIVEHPSGIVYVVVVEVVVVTMRTKGVAVTDKDVKLGEDDEELELVVVVVVTIGARGVAIAGEDVGTGEEDTEIEDMLVVVVTIGARGVVTPDVVDAELNNNDDKLDVRGVAATEAAEVELEGDDKAPGLVVARDVAVVDEGVEPRDKDAELELAVADATTVVLIE
ncbi:hypothetical protein B0A49_08893 [Cryomyces minteri]|uniref:Uncharacterized protein n=1 Tax=Cryomyces minteri TaxID=331657 RepID=A0A4U0X6M9_9PEZI|nr:hypothetical protein B0A49_08893 [Cryomyces minteri]